MLEPTEQIVRCMHFGFYYPKFNEDEHTYKLTEIQKILDKNGFDVNAINEYRSARRHIADIMFKQGLVGRKNKYQTAKEEIGLKFTDKETMEEMFAALNETDW